MDLLERRGLLVCTPNSDKRLDYIITLAGHLPNSQGHRRRIITLRYVPDRDVLDSKAYGEYLDALAAMDWPTPEDLAVTVITDTNDALIARWIQVALSVPELHHHAVDTHSVVLEDRQPGWDNPGLLSRLERI